jgi:hypothetical protein
MRGGAAGGRMSAGTSSRVANKADSLAATGPPLDIGISSDIANAPE